MPTSYAIAQLAGALNPLVFELTGAPGETQHVALAGGEVLMIDGGPWYFTLTIEGDSGLNGRSDPVTFTADGAEDVARHAAWFSALAARDALDVLRAAPGSHYSGAFL